MAREEGGEENHPEDTGVVDLESADVSHDPNRARFGVGWEAESGRTRREADYGAPGGPHLRIHPVHRRGGRPPDRAAGHHRSGGRRKVGILYFLGPRVLLNCCWLRGLF